MEPLISFHLGRYVSMTLRFHATKGTSTTGSP
jgi:hypothetical protein